MPFLSVLGGALRYEFWMQLRRSSVWITLIVACLLDFMLMIAFGPGFQGHYSPEKHIWIPPDVSGAILFWTQIVAWFLPLGVGLVISDRLARDHTLKVNEILATFAGSTFGRLLGKFLGALLATLIPVILLDAAGIGYVASLLHDFPPLGLAAEAFAAVVLPGAIFAAGFSLALPAVIKVPIYQILFIVYWFWADLTPPRFKIPTPVGTMLNATGPWAQEAFFHFQWVFLILNATVIQGIESIVLLVGLSFCAVIVAWGYLRVKQAYR